NDRSLGLTRCMRIESTLTPAGRPPLSGQIATISSCAEWRKGPLGLGAYFLGCLESPGANAPAIALLTRLKQPAVATAAFCDPRPTAKPLSAAALHGVGVFAFWFASPDVISDKSVTFPERRRESGSTSSLPLCESACERPGCSRAGPVVAGAFAW